MCTSVCLELVELNAIRVLGSRECVCSTSSLAQVLSALFRVFRNPKGITGIKGRSNIILHKNSITSNHQSPQNNLKSARALRLAAKKRASLESLAQAVQWKDWFELELLEFIVVFPLTLAPATHFAEILSATNEQETNTLLIQIHYSIIKNMFPHSTIT